MTAQDERWMGVEVEVGFGYPVRAYPGDGEVEVDIGADDRGWVGCAHPALIRVTKVDLERMLAALNGGAA